MPTWNFLVGLGIVDRGTGKFLKDTRTELDGTKKSFQGLGDTADGVADRTAQGARKMADAVHKSSRDIGRSWRDAGKSSREGMGGRGGGRGGRGGDKYGFLGFDIKDIGDKLKGLGSAGGSIFTGLAGDFGDMIDKNVEWSSSFKETAGISEKSVSRMAGSIITQMRRTGVSIREASGAWEDLRENLTSDEAVREMKRAVGLKEAFDVPPSTYANWVGTSEAIGMTRRDMTDLLDTSASMTKKMGLPKGFLKEMLELSDTTRDISMTFGLAPEKSMSMVKSMMRATAAMSKVLKGGIDAASRAVENMVKKTADRRKEMEKFRLGLGGDIDNVMDQVTELSRGVGDADFAFSLLMDQDTSNVIKRLQSFYKTIEGDKQAVERFRFTVEDAFGEDVANSVVRLGDKMQKEMGNAAKSQTANFGEMGKSIEDVMATATRAENKARMAEQIKLFQEGSLFVGEYVKQLNKYADAQDKIARKTTGWAASHKKIMEWISKYVVGKQMMEFAGGRRGGGFAGLIPTLGIPGAIIAGLLTGVGGMGRGVGLFGGVAGKLGGIQPLGWLKGLLGMGKGAGAGARGLGAGAGLAGAGRGVDVSGGIMGMTKASLGAGRAGAGAAKAAGAGRAGLGVARGAGGFGGFLGVVGKISVVLTAIIAAVDFLGRGIPRFVGIWKEGGTIWEKGWKTGVAYADTVSQVLNDLTFGLYKYIDIWGYIRRFLGDDFLLKFLPKFFSNLMGQVGKILKTVVTIGARIVKFGWDVNVARPLKVVWTILKGIGGAIGWAVQNLWSLDKAVWGWEFAVGKAFGGFGAKVLAWIGGPIEKVAKDAMEWIKDIIRVPMKWIEQNLGWIKGIWDKVFGPVKQYLDALVAWFKERAPHLTAYEETGGEGIYKDWGDMTKPGATPQEALFQKIVQRESRGQNILGTREVTTRIGKHDFKERAIGPSQILPSVALGMQGVSLKKLGKEEIIQKLAQATEYLKTRPKVSTALGAGLVDQLYKKYNGNEALIAAAYNWGEGKLDAFLAGRKFRGAFPIPPKETVDYVSAVAPGEDIMSYGKVPITTPTTAVEGASLMTGGDVGLTEAGGLSEYESPEIKYTGGGGGITAGIGGKVEGVLGSIVDALRRLKGDVFMDGKKIGEVVWGNIREKVEAEIREGVSTRG